ncbi:hypothetical protein [Tahibacter caeni]|uniref:hypothetical protein n=1 Tax=Tahibacter caeni TaxID=1453545 RepID=UPI002147F3B9|nr:hypothetical protein [Tahibacter caeni]
MRRFRCFSAAPREIFRCVPTSSMRGRRESEFVKKRDGKRRGNDTATPRTGVVDRCAQPRDDTSTRARCVVPTGAQWQRRPFMNVNGVARDCLPCAVARPGEDKAHAEMRTGAGEGVRAAPPAGPSCR